MSTLKANTLSNVAGTQSIPVDRVAQGTAAAWVNFNGTGTVAIRAAYNVTSITDNGVGNYTLNFTTALAHANYAAKCSCFGQFALPVTLTTTSLQVYAGYAADTVGGTGLYDTALFTVSIHM